MLFQIMFCLVFIVVIAMFVVTAIRGISQWNRNNHSPRLTVAATVVAKRANTSHDSYRKGDGHMHHGSYTTYYVTFQVDSGDRMELMVTGSEYGMLVAGDRGMLSFQGTRYLGFERN